MIAKEKSDFIISLAEPNGYINPETVIEAARDPVSPIHSEFTWDIQQAARELWIDQARTLIRFVKLNVTISNRSVVAPYYVVDPDRPVHSRRYVELTVAARNEDVARQIMTDELDRIAAAIRRAQQIADVLGLADELEELLQNVANIKTAAERRQVEKEAQRAAKVPRKRGRPRAPAARP